MPQTNKYASPYYENLEFTLNNSQTNYDLDANQSEFLAVFNQGGVQSWPTRCNIRCNDTIIVRFNSTSDDAITITSTDSPMDFDDIEIRNIFITTTSAGGNVAIKILLKA